jgi:3-isopropylmalate/(R)-2-methylmalate dehydratase small subunit
VIAARFGDIFRNNSTKMGLLPVVLDGKIVEELQSAVEADPATPITVDLVERQVRLGDSAWTFDLDDYTRWRLLEGLDDIGLTLRHGEAITAYENGRQPWLPTTV